MAQAVESKHFLMIDVETIQNVEGLASLFCHDQQVGFPHVGADEAQQ